MHELRSHVALTIAEIRTDANACKYNDAGDGHATILKSNFF
jgi:hypothetical protein